MSLKSDLYLVGNLFSNFWFLPFFYDFCLDSFIPAFKFPIQYDGSPSLVAFTGQNMIDILSMDAFFFPAT